MKYSDVNYHDFVPFVRSKMKRLDFVRSHVKKKRHVMHTFLSSQDA